MVVQCLCCRKESVWIPVSVSLSVFVCLFTLSPSLFGESRIALCSICSSAREALESTLCMVGLGHPTRALVADRTTQTAAAALYWWHLLYGGIE